MRVALYRLWTLRLMGTAAAAVLLGLAGCATSPTKDETLGWSSAKLYAEAKDEMNSGNTDKAVKLYEKLESRYPYGLLAQQALIEIAYGNYKQGERAQALAAADRFLKLYPNNPYTDYVLYLKGLINFNTDQGWFSFLSDQ